MNFQKIKYKIDVLLGSIRNAFQRARKGYCAADLWDIGNWFTSTLPKLLDEFEGTRHGYPIGLTDEEWSDILKQMSFYFKEANNDTCTQKNEIDYDCEMNFTPTEDGFYTMSVVYPTKEDEEKSKQFQIRENEIEKYKADCLKKGFELFQKHFYSLWD